ncbi:hypothetical protein BJ138DRAFT_1011235 [Hygrophoropsis aurantiaca]|uniref:Uncharacterized protein n=1 Tax=Hygrophoropsis aurantiaca TaxID=72124 RepID=A0ACB8A6Z5_9AGAM|nr:hypothetical protein BJ138DRAFT_1011235 [Hygrophoropsis aurantiaca]
MSDGSTTDISIERKPRRLVLCFDGTAGQYDATNTNVVKFFSLLKKDTDSQLNYYQAGIGTYFAPGVVSPVFTWLAKILDEAFAWYLDEHVMDGYKFLMDNYRPGDKICLFGFSRGAYTARALAGMLNKVGLLPRDNAQQVVFAYKAYKQTTAQGIGLAKGFKETFSQDVNVEFVGVWYTVQSTGVLTSRSLPFTDSNTCIRTFRHALALDEHRAKFRPNLYHRPLSTAAPEVTKATKKSTPTSNVSAAASTPPTHPKKSGFLQKLKVRFMKRERTKKSTANGVRGENRGPRYDDRIEVIIEEPQGRILVVEESVAPGPAVPPEPPTPTDVLEVWFAGCHSDVGGGEVTNSTTVSLAQITLRWMVEQVVLSQCGIEFDEAALTQSGIPPSTFPISEFRAHTHDKKGSPEQMRLKLHDGGLSLAEPGHSHTHVVPAPHIDSASAPSPTSAPTSTPTPNPPTTKPSPANCNALAPLHDALVSDKLWWLLEIVPLPFAWQDENGTWHKKWSIHLGKGRIIPYKQPKFHVSVKSRMEYIDYTPKANFTAGSEVFVHSDLA